MRLAGIINESIVDGPGIRLTIFFQGCHHHCPFCHNPQSWDFDGGYKSSIEKIDEILLSSPNINGVTISGGEPYDQKEELLKLLELIRNKYPQLDVIVYTGFTFEQLIENGYSDTFKYIDYIVDGPFINQLRDISLLFRGSSNQRFIDVKKSVELKKVISLADDEINLI